MAKKTETPGAVIPEQTSMENRAMVAQTPSELALTGTADDVSAWGAAPVSAQDIIIPRIFLMQPMSDLVTDGKAAFGEFRESLSNELLGKFEDGFEFVPFLMKKVFVEFDVTDAKDPQYIRTVPITPANDNLPYEDFGVNKDGKKIPVSRDRTLNFYGLLVKDLVAGSPMPYILSARRSSIKGGKKISTQMYVKNAAANKNPAATVLKVFATKTTNDKGTFAVLDAAPTGPTKKEWQAEAFKWMKMVDSGAVKETADRDEFAGSDAPKGDLKDVGVAQF